MKKVSILTIPIFLATAIVLIGQSRLLLRQNGNATTGQNIVKDQAIDYTMHTLLNNLPGAERKKLPAGLRPVAGVTSHHLPAAENFINSLYAQIKLARPEAGSFVIVGPDHFERCKTTAATTRKNFLTPGGLLENNGSLTKALLEAGVGEDNDCFVNEHSIGVQTVFIKKYFPNAQVTPLLFSSAVTADAAIKLAQTLAQASPDTVVICSTDFSHYETINVANTIDDKTEKQIKQMDVTAIKIEQVDSPASLNFTMAYAKLNQANVEYLEHANSYDFSGNPDNTTSYFDVVFGK